MQDTFHIYWMPVPSENLVEVERAFIQQLKPAWNEPRGGTRPGSGRPRKAIEAKTARHDGKYAFWIDGAHALKLQTLMLRDVPGVKTPDDMLEWLIDQA